jgi:hypothetical protein
VATECVIRPWERRLFLDCRRAWDLAAHERRSREPVRPARVVDLDRAVNDALAVYYFPGMWDWSRAIVAPLATEAFVKAMRTQRQAHEEATGAALDDAAATRWEADLAAGRRLLPAYYAWAAELDNWSTVQVEALFDVTVPDPDAPPGTGLLAADGRGVQYRVRIDLVVVDDKGKYWLMDHRLRRGAWAEVDDLVLDDQALTRAWAWELGFLATVSGTIHNELRLPEPGEPDTGEWFRRTKIPRSRAEIEGAGRRVGEQSRLMTRADLASYPTPAATTCPPCEFRAPCLAMMEGDDPEPVLERDYRSRVQRDFEEGRLGSVWGFVPHRPDHARVRLNPPAGPAGPGAS